MAELVVVFASDFDAMDALMADWTAQGLIWWASWEVNTAATHGPPGVCDDFPLIPSLRDFLQSRQREGRALAAVAWDEMQRSRLLAAVTARLKSRDEDHHVVLVVPLSMVVGLQPPGS